MSDSFQDIMSELSHGKPLDLEAEERVTPEETPEDGDNSDGKPESEAEGETKEEEETPSTEEGDETATDADPEKTEEESAEEEPTEEPEEKPDVIELDGEEVTLDQIREWKKDGLRQADYSRKTAEAADLKREALELKKGTAELAQAVSDDPSMRQFIAAHPEALAHLMARPEATRNMLGNPKAVEGFWKEYEVIIENPNLAERLLESPDDAEAEIQVLEEQKAVQNVISSLDTFVDYVGEQAYPGLDADPVKEYIVSLADVPDDPSHEQVVAGAERLFGLFFRKDENGQWTIDPRLITAEYERQKLTTPDPKQEEKQEEASAEEHNKNVDAQLQSDDMPPKTPDGVAPAAQADREDLPDDFQGILAALRSG